LFAGDVGITDAVGSEGSALMIVTPAMTPKLCQHCQIPFYRSGRPEQRFCSQDCWRADRYKDRQTNRRCECCPSVFSTEGRRKHKRFCSPSCVATWREREKRLNRPPPPPRTGRRKPGRLEWTISGMQRSRGMAPSPRPPASPPGWVNLLTRLGYARV
jgi:hypothetical protein